MLGFTLYSDGSCSKPTQFTFFQRYNGYNTQALFCAPYSLSGPYALALCDDTGTLYYANYSDSSCSVESSREECVKKGCTPYNAGYASNTIPCSCFHEDTLISYDGSSWTLEELLEGKESRCHVPHVVEEAGVEVWTSCEGNLRVTSSHLVFTVERGMVEAGKLRVGETLLRGYGDSQQCIVERVEVQHKLERYFGLNCEESVVLASGYRTSTFGVYHLLPSLWMKFISKILGVKMASEVGDKIAQFLFSFSIPFLPHILSL